MQYKHENYDDDDRLTEMVQKCHAMVEEKTMKHELLKQRLIAVPVDTLLYIAITRATWGLSVVEPNPRRFVNHYVIGKEGRQRSRAGQDYLAFLSVDEEKIKADDKFGERKRLHPAQVLIDAKSDGNTMDMSGKDLSLLPKCVLDMSNTTCLDLSVNNLQRLPDELWRLPLHELNLSHNPSLGRTLLSALGEAARCTTLKKLLLRNVIKGEA